MFVALVGTHSPSFEGCKPNSKLRNDLTHRKSGEVAAEEAENNAIQNELDGS